MTRLRLNLSIKHVIAFIALYSVLIIALRAPVDTDTYWHLRAGQYMVEHRQLLRTDVFSFTRSGESWLDVYWLIQIILFAVYSLLGNLGLALFTALLAFGGIWFVYRQCAGDPLVRALIVIIGSAAAAIFWTARPQMVSFFFGAIVAYLLWEYRKNGRDRLWVIPLIIVPWVNMHGGFVITYILLILSIVGEGLHAFFTHREAQRAGQSDLRFGTLLAPVRRLTVILGLSVLATMINPFGPRLLTLPFQTVGIGVLQEYIQEWASPNFHQPQTWPFIWLLLGTLGAAGLSSRRLDWRDAILVTGTAYLALLAGRNITLFVVVIVPVLVEHINVWLDDHDIRLNWDRIPRRGVFGAINWLLIVLVALAGLVRAASVLLPSAIDEAQREVLPLEAVEYLNDKQLAGHLFNSYNWGGYLMWAAPSYQVFVDGRTDLYGDEFLSDYLQAYFAQPRWESLFDEYSIDLVLLEPSSPLARRLEDEPGWSVSYQDDLAVIFERAEGDG